MDEAANELMSLRDANKDGILSWEEYHTRVLAHVNESRCSVCVCVCCQAKQLQQQQDCKNSVVTHTASESCCAPTPGGGTGNESQVFGD